MWAALPGLMAELEADRTVRAVLITGTGGHFSAGADIAEFPVAYADPAAARHTSDLIHAGHEAVTRFPKPAFAVVRGVCVGAGCGIAMGCDLRFAGASARFAMPPAKLGASYPFASMRQLVHLVGPARAKDMLFSGRLVGADEALSIGLADRLLADDALMPAALDYARQVADLSASSIDALKRTVQAICDGADAETDALRALFDGAFASDDFAEGYRAFLVKRNPRFR